MQRLPAKDVEATNGPPSPLPTETLRDRSFAATVEEVRRQLSSNPTEEEFEGAEVRLSEALCTFFEWPEKQGIVPHGGAVRSTTTAS